MDVRIVIAPFHAGVYGHRVGAGPLRLIEDGIETALRQAGMETSTIEIESVDAFEGEIGRSFEVKRRVAEAVRDAAAADAFPLVLAGNCNTAVGVAAGLSDPEAGLVWFDAHPDFDTPEEHRSGYFDGMGVATLAGQCWRNLAATIPGFYPMALERLIYCGIRDFEAGQLQKVENAGIRAAIGSTERRTDYVAALEPLLAEPPFSRAMIHLDVDSLDLSVGRANEYAAPGGIGAQELGTCLERVLERVAPVSLTIASFNPAFEGADRISAAAIAAAVQVASAA